MRLQLSCSLGFSDHLYILGIGPNVRVVKYNGLIVIGIRFHTLDRDKALQMQNSGVVVKAEHNLEEIDFYGVIMDIVMFSYLNSIVGMLETKEIEYGQMGSQLAWTDGIFVSINTTRKWYVSDPFVLAT